MSIGVRGKLLLAVGAVALMTVVASAVGWRFYARMERQFTTLLDHNIPGISAALKLAEASARYAAGGASLAAATNNTQRQNVDIALRQQAVTLRALLHDLEQLGVDKPGLAAATDLVARLEQDLTQLNLQIEQRLLHDRQRRSVLTQVNEAGARLSTALRDTPENAMLARAATLAATLIGRMSEIANAETVERVAALRPVVTGDYYALEGALRTVDFPDQGPRLENAFPGDGFDLARQLCDHQEEALRLRAAVIRLTRQSGDNAGRLSTTVARLVEEVERRSEDLRRESAAEMTAARSSLFAIAVATFIGPVAFVWVLIGRRIVEPLTALARSAHALAGGDMTAPIPQFGRDEMGHMAEALVAFRDAAAQLADRTRALSASEARLRSILDASVYPLMIVHGETARILFCNELARQLFHLDAAAAAGDFPDAGAWPALLEELWPKKRVVNLELSMQRADGGGRFWALVSAASMVYQEQPAVLASFNDISERKQTERQLSQARDEAEAALESLRLAQQHLVQSEKMASLGQLVAGVAHEINTPLGIALTSASYLSDETRRIGDIVNEGRMRRADFERYLGNAQETSQLLLMNITRAADLVHSFKQVSADQTSDSRRVFNLGSYLDDVLLSLKPSWKKAGHEVNASCPDNIEVDGYPGALSQILANLLVNALIHAYDEGQAGHIAVAVRALDNDWLELTFTDDGRGIPDDRRTRVFDPFFTTRRGAGSTGLGLNIVYNLVTLNLGGVVRLDSIEGRGTCFTLTFPRIAPIRAAGGGSGGDGGNGGDAGE